MASRIREKVGVFRGIGARKRSGAGMMDHEEVTSPTFAPVDSTNRTHGDTEPLLPGIGLCLSGGGYRAMLFHLGSLWRLRDAGLLPELGRVSSVSGGSIAAGMLGMNWMLLKAEGFSEAAFREQVVKPLRNLASKTIDLEVFFKGLFLPGDPADFLVKEYRQHLFGHRTLQDLPSDDEGPRFVINATNVQTMALWRFMRPYMADYTVGVFRDPEVELAVAVAASSAFPPVLSPLVIHPDPNTFDPKSTGINGDPDFRKEVVLSDGGVYDNLGLETVWKRYQTVLVSDGGGRVSAETNPKRDMAFHSLRIFEITDNQVRNLRKRQVIGSIVEGTRQGAYWGIRDDVAIHGANPNLPCPYDRTKDLALTPTRLAALSDTHQERLINWGYAVCDASLRRWYESRIEPAKAFPYAVGV